MSPDWEDLREQESVLMDFMDLGFSRSDEDFHQLLCCLYVYVGPALMKLEWGAACSKGSIKSFAGSSTVSQRRQDRTDVSFFII